MTSGGGGDPFTLTGGAAILALWNPIGGGGGGSRGGDVGGGGGGGGGGTSTGTPQNSTSTSQPPCPEMPMRPSEADIKSNIRDAATVGLGSFAHPGPGTFAKYAWFYNKVRTGGDWDYKKLSTYSTRMPNGVEKRQFEDFGNFHYGAIGAAAGFSEGQLLRMAGRVHTDPRTAQGKRAGPMDALLGRGGTEHYGDDPEDQKMIKQGMEYFRRGCYK